MYVPVQCSRLFYNLMCTHYNQRNLYSGEKKLLYCSVFPRNRKIEALKQYPKTVYQKLYSVHRPIDASQRRLILLLICLCI